MKDRFIDRTRNEVENCCAKAIGKNLEPLNAQSIYITLPFGKAFILQGLMGNSSITLVKTHSRKQNIKTFLEGIEI